MPDLTPHMRQIARLAGAVSPPPDTLDRISELAADAMVAVNLELAAHDLLIGCREALLLLDNGMPEHNAPRKAVIVSTLRAAIIKAGG